MIYLDDCIYSGTQFKEIIVGDFQYISDDKIIEKLNGIKYDLILMVPFLRKDFYDLIHNIEKVIINYYPTFFYKKDFIYFDHKLADSASTNETLINYGTIKGFSIITGSLVHNCEWNLLNQQLEGETYLIDKNLNQKVVRCPPTFYKNIKYENNIFPDEDEKK